MNRSGESQGNADISLVRKNIAGYVDQFHDDCLSGERLADAFVDILAQSGHTDTADETLKLLPDKVIPLVKILLQSLRDAEYRKILTPGPGCQLSDDGLADYAEELRSRYEALDALINDEREKGAEREKGSRA